MKDQYITIRIPMVVDQKAMLNSLVSALTESFDHSEIVRVLDEDRATAQQIQEWEASKKTTSPTVFIGDPNPDCGNRFADVFALLEHAFFSKVVAAIDDYWERQADGVDVAENVDRVKKTLINLASLPEYNQLRNFAYTYGNHLNAGGGD